MIVDKGDYVYIDLNGVRIGPYEVIRFHLWRTFVEVVVSIGGNEGSFDIEQVISKRSSTTWDGKDGF